MNRSFIYRIKVWLTAIGILYVTLLVFVFHGLSQPSHSKELDPFFATFLFVIANLFFIPAWGLFFLSVKPVVKRIQETWKRNIALNLIALVLVSCTFSPVLISHTSDETYYTLTGIYLLVISISVWLYRPLIDTRVEN